MLAFFLGLLISSWMAAPEPATRNHFETGGPQCESVPKQVAGEDRTYPGTRLDQQPPGKLLHAVDRTVDGCRVVTFVAEERQRAQLRR